MTFSCSVLQHFCIDSGLFALPFLNLLIAFLTMSASILVGFYFFILYIYWKFSSVLLYFSIFSVRKSWYFIHFSVRTVWIDLSSFLRFHSTYEPPYLGSSFFPSNVCVDFFTFLVQYSVPYLLRFYHSFSFSTFLYAFLSSSFFVFRHFKYPSFLRRTRSSISSFHNNFVLLSLCFCKGYYVHP